MRFCPKCGSALTPRGKELVCRKCGYRTELDENPVLSESFDHSRDKTVVAGGALPQVRLPLGQADKPEEGALQVCRA